MSKWLLWILLTCLGLLLLCGLVLEWKCNQPWEPEARHKAGPSRGELTGWQRVKVSWFDDRIGCQGNEMDPLGLHFAHRSLPFRHNGTDIHAPKLDYGPCPSTGLDWDLSVGCWLALGLDTAQGHAWVLVRM